MVISTNLGHPLPQDFYLQDTREVAQGLLGQIIQRCLPSGETLSGIIVETEAYLWNDPACHAFRGHSPRCATMFGPPGHAYVYFTYGLHFMLNAVCAPEGVGEAVLIRAVEPQTGIEAMRMLRGGIEETRRLTNGPGKLAQALGVSRLQDDGLDLTCPHSPLQIIYREKAVQEIVAARRIGISQATEQPWRYFLRGNPYVSYPETKPLGKALR